VYYGFESIKNWRIQNMENVLYTVQEVAELLKTNGTFVYKLINSGALPALKLGRMKVRKEALEDFLERNEGKDLSNPDNIENLRRGTFRNE